MADMDDDIDLPPPPPPPRPTAEQIADSQPPPPPSQPKPQSTPPPQPASPQPPPPAAVPAADDDSSDSDADDDPPPPPARAKPVPSAVAAAPVQPAALGSMGIGCGVDGRALRAQSAAVGGATPGVSHLASMLQATMLKPAAPAAIAERRAVSSVDSDSESDDEPPQQLAALPKKLGTAPSHSSGSSFCLTDSRWECEKANRYGLKDTRVVVLSRTAHAVRFYASDSKGQIGRLKAEIPLNQISGTRRRPNGEDARRVDMQFREERRSYELFFKTDADAAEFERLCSAEIDASASQSTRAYSASVHASAHRSLAAVAVPAHVHSGSFFPASPSSSRNARGESVAVHSELMGGGGGGGIGSGGSGVPVILDEAEDHNAYLDYIVTKKNKYGMRQQRILVINSAQGSMLLLDEKRKFKKEFSLAQVLSVEIPKAPEAQAYVVFDKVANQKPFHLFFADALDRLHFCERLVSLAPHELSIKDESDQVEDDSSLRFGILKLNKVGAKVVTTGRTHTSAEGWMKKRIVVLRPKERVLRSFNREKSYKDVSFSRIVRVEKPLLDRFRANIFLAHRAHPIVLIFPDPVARERFVCQCNLIRLQIDEEEIAASTPPSTTDAAGGVTTAGAVTATAAPRSANPPLSIFVGSWNLGNSPFAGEPLADFIPPMAYDLYCIGLQECSKGHRDQWLLELRAHIQGQSKSGTSGGGAGSGASGSVEDDMDDPQSSQPYALLGVVKLWEIVMMVLIRRPLAARVSNVCMDTVATGLGDVLGNKGGCGLSFCYGDNTLAFVACHLAARSERIVQRAENYQKILRELHLGQPSVDLLAQHDHVWWLGDLNYRNELEFSEVLQLVAMRDWKLLTQYDQLLAQMHAQLAFAGFSEGAIRFAPTYRWERKENVFSNKKFQAPSWTDRVLWHSLPGLADLSLDNYSSAPNVMGSDHRPVFATFTLQCRAPYTARLPSRTTTPIRLRQQTNRNILTAASSGAFISPLADPSLGGAGGPAGAGAEADGVKSAMPHRGTNLSVPSASSNKSLKLLMGAPPVGSAPNAPHQHYSAHNGGGGGGASLSVSGRPSAAPGASGAINGSMAPSASSKGFQTFPFAPAPPGPLFTPPVPSASLQAKRTPLIGNTRDFSIVLQQVKVTLGSPPRGDLTLTCSAAYLAGWPTTPCVSYPFGVEVGCHWEEVVLPPFIHDLYYLYTRHLVLVLSVPSDTSNATQQNQEQTGTGTQVGTAVLGLGTVCANLFSLLADMKPPTPPAGANAGGTAAAALPFNPLLPKQQQAAPSPAGAAAGAPAPLEVDPNSPALVGDHGAYYFIEPIYREGLYAGQIEGRMLFRYKTADA